MLLARHRQPHTASVDELLALDSPWSRYVENQLGGREMLERLGTHSDPPAFVRANTLGMLGRSREDVATMLFDTYGVVTRPHPGVSTALEILEMPVRVGTILHKFAGWFHMQSLGSMVPPLFLDAQPGERVLDMCAAPGSKTTQIAVMMEGRGVLWANELSGVRMNPLAASVDTLGVSNVVMTRFGGERLPNLVADTFDRILCDVPCTGLGRKQNLAHHEQRYVSRGNRPSALTDAQYSLVVAALKMLRVGGRMVYSTCSLAVDENEGVLDAILRRFPVRVVEPEAIPGLVMHEGRTQIGARALHPELRHARRLTPWENPSDGFFAAILEKTGPCGERYWRKAVDGSDVKRPFDAEHPDVAPLLDVIEAQYGLTRAHFAGHGFNRRKDKLFLVAPEIEGIWTQVNRVGLPLGVRRGRSWKLSHVASQRFGSSLIDCVDWLDSERLAAIASTGVCPTSDTTPDGEYLVIATEGLGPFAVVKRDGALLRWKRSVDYAVP